MKFAVCFTNFGPYHLARLRALAARLNATGDRLIGYEVAGSEHKYPWRHFRRDEPFEWTTLFPDRTLETIARGECRAAILEALERDRPDAVGSVGYVRPESMAAARWARRRGLPTILMSESQAIDRPHLWWKELIKRRRLRLFDAALVGGPTHRDYLVQLGMPPAHIALGYNAVDNDDFARNAMMWRQHPAGRADLGLPDAPYFLTVCRFVHEKNLFRLIKAFARYRSMRPVHRLGARHLRRWAACPRARASDHAKRLHTGDSLPWLPSGRCADKVVCARRGVRAPESFRALGACRQ